MKEKSKDWLELARGLAEVRDEARKHASTVFKLALESGANANSSHIWVDKILLDMLIGSYVRIGDHCTQVLKGRYGTKEKRTNNI